MIVLSGDIGGTKTRLALFETDGRELQTLVEKSFPSGSYTSLDAIVRAFLQVTGASCPRACFGVAGPVQEGRCHTTNLPWEIDAAAMQRDLGFAEVRLLNDLEANAWGIPALEPKDFCLLQPGRAGARGNAAVIAAGTGLGEAGMYWDGKRHHPFASEGGHTDFSPGNDLEIALLQHLRRSFEHVSWERVVSGPGLVNLHGFLCEHSASDPPAWLQRELQAGDPAAAISRAALGERDPLCSQALDLFVYLYGVEAGNQALKVMATGGVYLGGGIAPKILERLKGPRFLEGFTAKGRMAPLLRQMAVRVILNDRTALYGPALFIAGT
jgi:glucokinase